MLHYSLIYSNVTGTHISRFFKDTAFVSHRNTQFRGKFLKEFFFNFTRHECYAIRYLPFMDKITNTGAVIFFTLLLGSRAFCQDNRENDLKPYFCALVVENAEASSEWYQSVLELNFRNKSENIARGSKIIVLSSNDAMLELIEVKSQVSRDEILNGKPQQTLVQGFTKIGFKVSNLDATIKKLKALNVKFFGEVYTDPISNKRSLLVQDPDKNLLQFFE